MRLVFAVETTIPNKVAALSILRAYIAHFDTDTFDFQSLELTDEKTLVVQQPKHFDHRGGHGG